MAYTETEKQEFAKRLRQAIDLSGGKDLSQRELADRLGVTPSMINQMLLGKKFPSLKVAYSLSQELGVSFQWLMVGSHPKLQKSIEEIWESLPASEQTKFLSEIAIKLSSKAR